MSKIIIVPTDFSSCAMNAADYAAEVAIDQEAQLILFHSGYVRYSEAGMMIDYSEQIRMVSQEYLREEESRLKSQYPALDEKISSRLVLGDLDAELNDLAKSVGAFMIIMGTKGRSGWEELLLGSETARIIDGSIIPVLAIPPNYRYKKAKSTVYACSLQEQISSSDEQQIEAFIDSEAQLHLYHNYQDYLEMDAQKEHSLLQEFHQHFKQYIDLELSFNINHIESIEKYAESVNADFLIVRKTHQPFLKELFRISISKGLSYRVKMPLLVLH